MNRRSESSLTSLALARPATLRGLPDADLLGQLLESGRKPGQRADRLLQLTGGWRGLRRWLYSDASGVDLQIEERLRVGAALEVGRRLLCEQPPDHPLIDPATVAARYRPLAIEETEHLVAVGLDAGRRPVVEHRLGGAVDGVHAHPRDLLRPLIAAGAVAMIAVHNHPSGCGEPSAADLAFTARLAEAADLCGVPLLDHVIIAGAGWTSLAMRGQLAGDNG